MFDSIYQRYDSIARIVPQNVHCTYVVEWYVLLLNAYNWLMVTEVNRGAVKVSDIHFTVNLNRLSTNKLLD